MTVTSALAPGPFGNLRLLRLLARFAPCLLAALLSATPAAAAIATATTLTVSSAAVSSGTAVTLTAYVHASSGGPYGGQVAFCDAAAAHCTDIHQLGVATLLAGYANFKFIPGPGAHSYKAIYLGNTSFAASTSASVGVSVTPLRATTTTIAQSGSSGSYSLSSTVSGAGSTPPSGSVSFLDTSNSNDVLGTGVLGAGSSAFSLVLGSACSIGQTPGDVAVGDFNRDGIPDLAVISPSVNGITICLAHLDGTFSTLVQTLPSSTSLPVYLITGDFNNDGIPDLLVYQQSTVTNNNQTFALLTGNGDGTFTGSTNLSGASHGNTFRAVTGDFDGDGNADLAYIQEGLAGYDVVVYRGKGDGTFYASSSILSSPAGEYPVQLAAADLNNDGRADLIVLADFSATVLRIELGNSDGSFTAKTQTLTALPGPSLVIADSNQDGNPDLSLILGSSVVILNGNGDGTFTQGTTLTPAASPSFLRVGDFNGDGHADLAAILSGSSNNVAVYLGAGDGTFTTPPATITISSPAVLASADFTGNGFSDLAVLPGSGSAITALLGTPTSSATVTVSSISPVGSGTHQVLASYPGDTNFAASTSGTTGLVASKITGQQFSLSASPASNVSGRPVTLTAAISPYTAQGHSTDGETVAFNTFPGGHAIGTGTLASGVATLTLSTLPVGTSDIQALYSGDSNFASDASNDIFYTVSAVTSITLATGYTSAPFGTAVALTATVLSGSTPITPGVVAFCDAAATHCTDVHRLGTAQLTSSGTATLRITPPIGTHTYKAVFLGTTAAAASSSATSTLTITGRFPTVTTLASSGSSGNYTLAASVVSLTRSPLSGNVAFTDTTNANASLGSATIPFSSSTFALGTAQTLVSGIQPKAVATGDFNNDGKQDFVVANYGNSTLTVQLGNGDGTFTAAASVSATLSNPNAIAVGDFNNDGKQDLAVANYASGTVSIFLGNGDGTFAATSSLSGLSPQAIVTADFNNDGVADLAVATTGTYNYVYLFLGRGDGTFSGASVLPVGNYPAALVAANFNNDGFQDIAVANVTDRTITVFFGAGTGQFPTSRTLTNTGSSYSLATADLDADGNADLIALDSGGNTVTILRGNGTGAFTPLASPVTATNPMAVAVGDLNGDGIPDLVTANNNASTALDVFFGNGDGTFQAPIAYATGIIPQALALADFNADGSADPVTANFATNNASVLLAQTQQTAIVSVQGVSPTGSGTSHAAQATYPGDATHAASSSNLVSLTPLPYAAAPTFSPVAGTYTAAQTITLSTSTPGATIFYTTDGSTPTTSSAQYSAPISITSYATINAIASAANYQNSLTATAAYTINYPPTITTQPANQTITSGSTATLSVVATSATPITYQWFSGTSPNTANPIAGATSSTYTTPTLTATTPSVATFNYWVQVNNASAVGRNSNTATITVNALPFAASPTFSPAAGTYTSARSVTLTSNTPTPYSGIYYTTDGSAPTTASPQYTAPIPVTASETIRAITAASGYQNSPVSSATYTINYAPNITAQPASQTINSGSSATLTVSATGTAPLTYQWFSGLASSSLNPILGATTASYITGALTATTYFQVRVNNAAAMPATSTVATITVITPPTITAPPASQTINSGGSATLTVSATGTAPLTYQWFAGPNASSLTSIAGATSASYTASSLNATTYFQVQVNNASAVPASAGATITVINPPAIITPPAAQTINAGSSATLTVSATGTAPLTYQWFAGASPNTANPIAGATASTYTTPVLTATSTYWVQVNNASAVPANSNTATVTVIAPPNITAPPISQTINSGTSVTLTVLAAGTAPFTYQWSAATGTGSFMPIAGATTATYITPALTATTSYQVQVTNAAGSVAATATITVITPPTITAQTPSPTINTGQTATLGVTATGTSPTYQWFNGPSPNTAFPIAGATSSTYTTPALTVTSSFWVQVGNSAATRSSATFLVTVTQTPVCTLTVQPTSTPLTVVATSHCTDPQSQTVTQTIAWGDNTSTPATGTNSHTYATAGAYTVIISATNTSGLTGTATQRVSPNQSPVCILGVVQGGISNVLTQYPVSMPASCTDPQGQPLTLSLDWGDGTVITPSTPPPYTHTYTSATTVTYNVVLTATDASGLIGASAPQPVQIVPAQPIPAGGSTPVATAIPPPPLPPTVATQVTFLCSSVSVLVNGQTVTTLPSTYGISCTSPSVPLTASATPVNVTITTSNGALAADHRPASTLALCGLACPFLGLAALLPLTPGKRRRLTALALACILCLSLSACGGYFQPPAPTATPTGLYYITLVETVVPPQIAPTGFVQTSLIVPLPVTH